MFNFTVYGQNPDGSMVCDNIEANSLQQAVGFFFNDHTGIMSVHAVQTPTKF